jgi:sugar phosphate isomerase/epimerase
MIEGIRQIADAAARWEIEVVLENNIADWTGIADDTPEEWIRICADVGRANVALCLDTSRVCTYLTPSPTRSAARTR